MYTKSPNYLYRRNGTYYFTRQVPSEQKAINSANKLQKAVSRYIEMGLSIPEAAFISGHKDVR